MLQVTIGVLALSAVVFCFGLLSARKLKKEKEDRERQKMAVEDLTRSNKTASPSPQRQESGENPIFTALGGTGQKTVSR